MGMISRPLSFHRALFTGGGTELGALENTARSTMTEDNTNGRTRTITWEDPRGAAEAGRDYNTTDMSRVRMYNEYFPPYKAAVDAGAGF